MKNVSPPTTVDLIIVACLAIAGAVLTIAREVLVPLVALALYLAGWRPGPTAPDRLPWVQYAGRTQRTDADFVNSVIDLAEHRAHRGQQAHEIGYMLATHPTTTTPMEPLTHVHHSTLKRMARNAGLATTGTAQQIRERLAQHAADEAAVDHDNNTGPKALTAEQRNAGGLS